jgi:hypothetical protein
MHDRLKEPARILRHLVWPAALLLLCVGFYWKLVLTDQYTWLDSPDLANLEAPRAQFLAGEIRHSRLPLWEPHQWAGQPMLGQFTGSAYPINWVLSLMPFKQGKIQFPVLHWYFVLIHFQAALFCYLLCRDLKRSPPASAAAGLVFALGGYLGDTGWAQLINTALWAPLIFMFLLRAARGRRPLASAALSGVFLGISWLGGHHEVPTYLGAAVGFVWLTLIFRPGAHRWASLRLAMVTFFFAALTSGYQLVPGYEYGRLATRWSGVTNPLTWRDTIPYTVHQDLSFTPASILGVLTPGLSVHVSPFIGVAACALVALGLLAGWRRQRTVLFFAAFAVGALLLSIGSSNVFHGILYSLLPTFDKARAPSRAIALFSFALAPMVAYGFDALFRKSSRALLRKVAASCAFLAAAIVLIILGASYLKPFDPRAPLMLTALTAFLTAILFTAWDRGLLSKPAAIGCILFLILFELGNVTTANLPNQTSPNRPGFLARLSQHDDIAAFFRWQKEPVRVNINEQEIPYNFGDWHGVNTLGGYLPSVTTNTYALGTHHARIQDLLAVNFSVDSEARRPGQELVSRSNSGLNIYRNTTAFPRAWIVHEAVRVMGEPELQQALLDPNWDLRMRAPMLDVVPSGLAQCASNGSARITAMKSTSVSIDARLDCGGMLVLADTAFPGWQAEVDGRPARIHEVYGALRGVVVEAGTHRVEFRYRPASAFIGGFMSLLGLAGAIVLVIRDRRNSNRRSRTRTA